MPTDADWMQHAIHLARYAESCGEVPVGAIVVYNNEIVAEGWNQPITSCDPTAHAEIIALRHAAKKIGNYRLIDTTLYTTLEPCLMCAGALVHARIKQLVYGADDFKMGAVKSVFNVLDEKALNHRVQWQSGVQGKECGELLTRFFKAKR